MLVNLSPVNAVCKLVDFEFPCQLGFGGCNVKCGFVGHNVQGCWLLVDNMVARDLARC